jgi:SAM-dependent methyltransferase
MPAAGGFDDAKQFWDARFAAPDYIFGTAPNVFLAAQRTLFQPGMRCSRSAAVKGATACGWRSRVAGGTGVDISPRALAKADKLAAERGVKVQWIEADIVDWVWQAERFDAVACIFIQFAAPEGRQRIFSGMQQTLCAGGSVLLQGYTPRQLQYGSGGPRDIDHLYTRELLERSLAECDIIHLQEHDEVLAEGTKHVGMAALIDVIARKRG